MKLKPDLVFKNSFNFRLGKLCLFEVKTERFSISARISFDKYFLWNLFSVSFEAGIDDPEKVVWSSHYQQPSDEELPSWESAQIKYYGVHCIIYLFGLRIRSCLYPFRKVKYKDSC